MLEPSLKRKFWALYSEIIKNFSNCRALNQARDPSVGSVLLLRWRPPDAHSEGRRWVERNEGDRKGGSGSRRREGRLLALLGSYYCISSNTHTTLRLIVHFIEEETEAKKGDSSIPSHD